MELPHPRFLLAISVDVRHSQTHRAQGYAGGRKTNKSTITGMRLMDCICKIMAELIDYFPDLLVILGGSCLSD
jgi:hypothetical protein